LFHEVHPPVGGKLEVHILEPLVVRAQTFASDCGVE